MGTVTIMEPTVRDPITLIGRCAGVCWGADTTDDAKNYRRGWDCITSDHGRTLEFPDVYMTIDGYSARVIREWYTHIGCLPTRLQESTRYVDCTNFPYIIPHTIQANSEALGRYMSAMDTIRRTTSKLEEIGIPREDVANLLPLGMTTRIVDKRNLRNLIDMSHNRECVRALWEFREMFRDLKLSLATYSDEWAQIVAKCFMPKCKLYGFCTEKHSCGMMPKRSAKRLEVNNEQA